MAARSFTPVNQVRLTNVAVVRHKKGGKRFELACYPNKVVAWRNKTEKNLDEVLQTPTIFTNVSKGAVANKAELTKAYNTEDQSEIVLEILAKGELQVGKQERESQLEASVKEIAGIVTDKCINPETKRPYTVAQIERAMRDIHFSVKPGQTAKAQALDVIRQLKETIPIERAKMRLRFVLPKKDAKRIKDIIAPKMTLETEEWQDQELELICSIDPGMFRELEETVRAESKGKGQMEILMVKTEEDAPADDAPLS